MLVICCWQGGEVVIKGLAETRLCAAPLLRELSNGHYAVSVEVNGMFDAEYLRADMKRQYLAGAKARAEIRKNDPPIVIQRKHPKPLYWGGWV